MTDQATQDRATGTIAVAGRRWNAGAVLAALNSPLAVTGAAIAVFLAAAVFGWLKLPYGLNFLDEGMYMTDGWRLAAGDSLFPDSSTNVVRLYAVFNAFIFKLFPDITLLSFRRLQYVATLAGLAAVGLAAFRHYREAWPFLLAGSLFAMTGLDPNGMASNMSYYTYPHLFLTLHVASLLVALQMPGGRGRIAFLVISAVSLWAIGFAMLPLAVSGAAFLIMWALDARCGEDERLLEGRELALIVTVFAVLWLLVLSIYNVDFVTAADKYRSYWAGGGLIKFEFDPDTPIYLALAAVLYAAFRLALRLKGWPRLVACLALSVAIFSIIQTDGFGQVERHWRGWFPVQMWFSCFLLAYLVHFVARTGIRLLRRRRASREDRVSELAMTAVAVIAFMYPGASGLGVMAIAYVAIPAMMLLAWEVVRQLRSEGCGRGPSFVLLAALLLPFYASVARADWDFTYFDLKPNRLSHTIPDGFAAGIVTNLRYLEMVRWIERMAEMYSSEGDFALMLEQTAMGYMLAKRRPAINHSWSMLAYSADLRRDTVAGMIRRGRQPKIAMLFDNVPMLYPDPSGGEVIELADQRTFYREDPLIAFVFDNMTPVRSLNAGDTKWITLYVLKENVGVAR